MSYSIFYSWQSDSPHNCNRGFIRECLDDAITKLSTGATVEDAPRVDSGMEGISGSPEVATVMFEKIKTCAIFIGDMTLVGGVKNHNTEKIKRTPNPNVLLEMGYAAGTVGWSRIICVINEHYGKREELPFDVRNRRFPINYVLDPDNMSVVADAKKALAKYIKFAIETVIKNDYEAVSAAVSSLDINCLELMYKHGKTDSFAAPDSSVTIIGGALDSPKFDGAVIRLLDLRLLRADVNVSRGLYAYHWTYLGKEVLKYLNIRL